MQLSSPCFIYKEFKTICERPEKYGINHFIRAYQLLEEQLPETNSLSKQ